MNKEISRRNFLQILFLVLNRQSEREEQLAHITVEGAHVRSEPNTSSEILRTLHQGDAITIQNIVPGEWVSIPYDFAEIKSYYWADTGKGQYVFLGLTNAIEYSLPNPAVQEPALKSIQEKLAESTVILVSRMSHPKQQQWMQPTQAQRESFTQVMGSPNWLGYPPDALVTDEDGDGIFTLPAGRYLLWGFAMNPRSQVMYHLEGRNDQEDTFKVDIYWSEEDQVYFLLPYINLEPFKRPDGRYYGIHPSGTFMVLPSKIDPFIAGFGPRW